MAKLTTNEVGGRDQVIHITARGNCSSIGSAYNLLEPVMLGKRTGIAFSLLVLAALQPAAAGTYEDGEAAFLKKDYVTAIKHWRAIAKDGNARAQLGIGRIYYGGLGVARDYDKAFEWFSRAADQGNPEAQYLLGAMYRDGKGIKRDGFQALSLFLKASNQGIVGAQYNLGLLYLTGDGVRPDHSEAYFWLSLAANSQGKEHDQLRAAAAFARDDAAAKLSAGEIADAKRRIDKWKPAPSR